MVQLKERRGYQTCIGNGLPNPRCPRGGNFVLCTSLLTSSAVCSNGTHMPWAPESSALFTIHASFAGIRTIGETPHAAIAATASCIWLSAMLPCSPSTHIQSTPDRAIAREWLVPGSICQPPKVGPPALRTLYRREPACMAVGDVMLADVAERRKVR